MGAKILESEEPEDDLDELMSQIGKLLAHEYLNLMKKEDKRDESGDLCEVLERKPETGEH